MKRKIPDKELVQFKFRNKDNSVGYITGNVHLDTFSKNYQFLKTEIFIPQNRLVLQANKEYELIVDYPLSTPFKKKIKGPKTFRQLVDIIVSSYRKIYNEERKTSKLKEETYKERTKSKIGLLNRAPTDGKYGIWGHMLRDLELNTIYVKGNKIYLGVDS